MRSKPMYVTLRRACGSTESSRRPKRAPICCSPSRWPRVATTASRSGPASCKFDGGCANGVLLLLLEVSRFLLGYPADTARQSVFQFMKTGDPRLSVLRRFAQAMGLRVRELIEGSGDERIPRTKGRADKKTPSSRKKGRADSQA